MDNYSYFPYRYYDPFFEGHYVITSPKSPNKRPPRPRSRGPRRYEYYY